MKYLTLIRHAKSVSSGGAASDRERGLSPRGEQDGRVIGAVLFSFLPKPDLLLASSARRVRETVAALRAGGAAIADEQIEHRDELYLADREELVEFGTSALLEFDDVWIIGHNPGITEAIEAVSGARLEHVPTLAVARVAFEEVLPEHPAGELVFFTTPRAHRK